MKIMYVTISSNVDISSGSGVGRKVYGQCKALHDLGHHCKLLIKNNGQMELYDIRDIDSIYQKKATFLKKLAERFVELFSPIRKNVIDRILEYSPDIIYIRHMILYPSYIHFFKKIKNNAKIIWEFPTYPYLSETFVNFNFIKLYMWIFEFRSMERLHKFVDKFVVVNEIDDKAAEAKLGKYVVIPNGFDVSSVPVKKIPELKNEIHILGLANLAAWHGYDRIIAGISEYKGHYRIIFHLVVGSGKAEAEKLKKQVIRLGISHNIIFYPALYGKELSDLFDICHVAADAVGIHRKKLNKASTLKAREYCSRGIPFFTSCIDEDFENFKFCLIADASDEPIDIDKLCVFVETAYKTENHPQIMRAYAEEKLDWKAKMSKLFD